MNNKKEIVPSLLAFQKSNWSQFFDIFQNNNIKFIHFDVMDKEYVNNTAYDHEDYKLFLNDHNHLEAHVHLMVMDPLNEVNKYFNKKTDAICFHFDVYKDPNKVFECLNKIKSNNIKAGIAINPNFTIDDYEMYLKECDFITVMGVYPGKGGQSFETSCINNLLTIRNWSIQNNKEFIIELDGGMNFDTIPLVIKNSDCIVSGSFLEKNITSISDIISWFDNLINR